MTAIMQGNPVSRLRFRSVVPNFSREIALATHKVNLDALIPREDFELGEQSGGISASSTSFKVAELENDKLFYSVLRKPDFQRVTDNWTPEMIVDFVESFLDDKFIPSLILWQSKKTKKIFVVDGAHRVSALIAWVNNDYGDGAISKAYFSEISKAQSDFHETTKTLMAQRVGDYTRVEKAGFKAESTDLQMVLRARTMGQRNPPIQIVEGDAATAEESFFKINCNPATINPTELDVIRARRKPNAIATRAIINRGVPHNDWSKFEDNAKKIGSLSAKAFDLIFGKLYDISSTSADIPRAGQPYSQQAFNMVLDIVNLFNSVRPAMWQLSERAKKKKNAPTETELKDDTDGSQTIEFIERVIQVCQQTSDNNYSGSFGLDHAVYSYGVSNVHPAAFIASLKFAEEQNTKQKRYEFTSVRRDFEEFIVGHKRFISTLSHEKGGRTRPVEAILTMHRIVLQSLLDGLKTDEQIIGRLLQDEKLATLASIVQDDDPKAGKGKFSRNAQQAAVVRETLANRARCRECGARLPPHARSKDHIVKQADGGSSHSDNLAFTHPYCNSGYKEAKLAKTKIAR